MKKTFYYVTMTDRATDRELVIGWSDNYDIIRDYACKYIEQETQTEDDINVFCIECETREEFKVLLKLEAGELIDEFELVELAKHELPNGDVYVDTVKMIYDVEQFFSREKLLQEVLNKISQLTILLEVVAIDGDALTEPLHRIIDVMLQLAKLIFNNDSEDPLQDYVDIYGVYLMVTERGFK